MVVPFRDEFPDRVPFPARVSISTMPTRVLGGHNMATDRFFAPVTLTPAQTQMRALLSRTPKTYIGYNLEGNPFGDDSDYRDKPSVEDFNVKGWFDPLVEITGMQVEPLYYGKFTGDPRQFLRLPALRQFQSYDRTLRQKVGIGVRARDAYRPYTVQVQGFRWGVEQILSQRGEDLHAFKASTLRAMNGKADTSEVRWVLDIVDRGNRFFSYVRALPTVYGSFPGVEGNIVTCAANFALAPNLNLDKYAPTAHGHGGVLDNDWIDLSTGRLLQIGVPVDFADVSSAFPFFEETVATGLVDTLTEKGLLNVRDRIFYYREQVRTRSELSTYLDDCEVDVQRLLSDDEYLMTVTAQARDNRRIVLAIADAEGIVYYLEEGWHGDADNRYGGVAIATHELVSGGGTMAAYMGQPRCAWGNATLLWEQILNQGSSRRRGSGPR